MGGKFSNKVIKAAEQAIPREAFATITVGGSEENEFLAFIEEANEAIAIKYKDTEPEGNVKVEKTDKGPVVAGDFVCDSTVEVMNPEKHICTITGNGKFHQCSY